jgi:hypothetical protein
MKVIDYWFIQCKITECRIASIEEKIVKLQDLSLFYQSRFDNDRSDKIRNKIESLSKRKNELMAVFQYGS